MTGIFIVGIFAALLFVMAFCLIAYLAGHKKGVEETVDFYNGVWKEQKDGQRRSRKMNKYRVVFIQNNTYPYIVEASNREVAKEKAYGIFLDEMRWHKPETDFDRIEVEALEDGSTTD